MTNQDRSAFRADDAKERNLIGSRLQAERRSRGWTLDDLSEILAGRGVEVKRGSISKWELGDSCPNSYQLLALCDVYGIDDALAFFSDRPTFNEAGRKKLAEYRADLIATGKYAPAPRVCEIRYVRMPVSLLTASAGTGDFLDDDSFEYVDVPADSVPAGAEFGVRVCGDSMEPVFTNGQIVWVRRCSSLTPGSVGIFTLDGSGYIKVYDEREPEDPEEFCDCDGVMHRRPVLLSYNKKYDPIVAGEGQRLQIVGRVL